MRDRFIVTCLDCDEVLHGNTTGPTHYIQWHLERNHGMRGRSFTHIPRQ